MLTKRKLNDYFAKRSKTIGESQLIPRRIFPPFKKAQRATVVC